MDTIWKTIIWQQFGAAIDMLESRERREPRSRKQSKRTISVRLIDASHWRMPCDFLDLTKEPSVWPFWCESEGLIGLSGKVSFVNGGRDAQSGFYFSVCRWGERGCDERCGRSSSVYGAGHARDAADQ
ncbi:MAG TPA: hypothetical protein VKM72_26960 [Thermoanaerobaculia bacterium]|nr:hypothetical protein [Thermoanaerobaculia bacterium]